MRSILQKRPLRLVFTANVISMLGSGMNAAAVTWYILQATHSEVALGTLVVLQTIPAMLLMPFTGVIIDRQDRRRLVMLLDVGRAVVVLVVVLLAFFHRVQLWHVYAMAVLVAVGFWMFWPTITALIQELTPDQQYVHSNTFLLAGVQGGWLLAGALVGFVYNHIGLGGVLLIDFGTYVASFLCYLFVRKGRHVVERPAEEKARLAALAGPVARYLHEMQEGVRYLGRHRYVVLLGACWALFIGAMLSQGVVTAPLSDRILHAGAVGYGWLNMGWGVGAFLSAAYVPLVIASFGARRVLPLAMAVLSTCLFVLPFSKYLALAVLLYMLMGSSRGVGGIAISSSMMEIVPKHFMGRVQNTFYFAGTFLQVILGFVVGVVAHRIGLAVGFAIIGGVYGVACLTSLWPLPATARVAAVEEPAAAATPAE